jgi:hypothetical protein
MAESKQINAFDRQQISSSQFGIFFFGVKQG